MYSTVKIPVCNRYKLQQPFSVEILFPKSGIIFFQILLNTYQHCFFYFSERRDQPKFSFCEIIALILQKSSLDWSFISLFLQFPNMLKIKGFGSGSTNYRSRSWIRNTAADTQSCSPPLSLCAGTRQSWRWCRCAVPAAASASACPARGASPVWTTMSSARTTCARR